MHELTTLLDRFRPEGDAETADVRRVRALLESVTDPYRRDLPLHVTASALIVHPPTGRVGFTEVIDICRIEGGKIVEHWGVPDQLGMMLQLGLIAPPARPAPVSA